MDLVRGSVEMTVGLSDTKVVVVVFANVPESLVRHRSTRLTVLEQKFVRWHSLNNIIGHTQLHTYR